MDLRSHCVNHGVDWIHLAQYSVQRRAIENMVMNLWFQKVMEFLDQLNRLLASEEGPCAIEWVRVCTQKFPDWDDNEINNNRHSLRSNTKGYGGKTH
jgi:hypothetical protein